MRANRQSDEQHHELSLIQAARVPASTQARPACERAIRNRARAQPNSIANREPTRVCYARGDELGLRSRRRERVRASAMAEPALGGPAARSEASTAVVKWRRSTRGTTKVALPRAVSFAFRSLRHQFVAKTVLAAFQAATRAEFRIVHWSIQPNHLHLIVEAQSADALSSGMRGLAVRLARRINRLLFRRGALWADRWFGVELTSPRQVRNALVYVLQNHAKHSPSHRPGCDPLSSAAGFDGFATVQPGATDSRAGPTARTWLLRIGWKRHGLIRQSEVPMH